MSANLVIRFEVIASESAVPPEAFDQEMIKVGRLASCQLHLDDQNVSRIHAAIQRGSDGYTVMDLGSTSGTYVNGEKVTKSEISSGDEIKFGDTVLRAFIEDASARVSVEAKTSWGDDGGAPPASAPVSAGTITTADGSSVEPYTLQGYYDDGGNYIPGYYDEAGEFHLGYGFYNESGDWEVSFGYYDPDGEWIATDSPVSAVAPGESDLGAEESWIFAGVRDKEVYQESFFNDRGGDTLEVARLWNDHVLDVVSPKDGEGVTIGSSNDARFPMEDPAIPDDLYPLVVAEAGGHTVNFTRDMGGLIQDGDRQMSLQEAIDSGFARGSAHASNSYSINLSSRTRVRLDVGSTTFLIHFTDMPVIIGGTWGIDTTPLPFLLTSAAAHILFLLLAMTWPDTAGSLNLDGFQASNRFVQLMIEPEQEEEELPDWLNNQGDEEAAAKHKGEEGQAGKEDSEQVDKKMAIQGPADNEDLELKRARDIEIASTAGIAGELQVASLWGTSDQSVGSDAIHALGNLQGDSFGEARGFGGLGLHGAGRGGGGVSERGIGLANVGTAGRGGGGRGGTSYGRGASDLGERSAAVPKIVPGNPTVQGSLDREIIRRVVRQHRQEIRNCYEQELQKNRNLAGRVMVRFTIQPNGSVANAIVRESSLNNATVESCMTRRIQRWVFPEPKGGGIVIVNYPFNLSS